MFEVKWDPKAEEQLEKLPRDISRRIVIKTKKVAENGRGIEPLKEFVYGFKIRAGDYRALVDVYFNPDIIAVRAVGHRKNIYKN
ncbi:MAG: type II toxin-antitoxin system RelE/ParE family toxin [Candidatus Woesearchaeota archaeon]|nr:MAG: type II toxin-antitoxin system RelE/ParE family toxin [Candidatus Woesearchaeota archaeon]